MTVQHAGPRSGPLLALLARFVLFVTGWKAECVPLDCPRAIFIAAPHTSNWDTFFMLATAWAMRMKLSWVGKHTLFEGPLGPFLRAAGGIPVDRRARHNMVQQVAEQLRAAERMYLAVAPEGTRKFTDHWKTGFYHMAMTAQVPLVFGFLDFGRKVGGVGGSLMPTGDLEKDFEVLRAFYEPIQALIPADKGPVRLKNQPPAP